jgi:NAD(P)-dependent dehydrogenase (short-subunit alcohol dehydrogenase family)
MELDGKVAIITGAGRGIGRAVAIDLARQGACVVAASPTAASLTAVREAIEADGGTCLDVPTDIGERDQVDALVDKTLEQFGRVDIYVNTAAIRIRKLVMDMSPDDWERVLRVNLTGTFHACQAVARPMIAAGSGTMILFASDRGLFGQPTGANYAASKGGVIAFGKTLALELGKFGVTVNVLNPGTIPTERPGTSEEEQRKLEAHRRERAARDPLGRLNTAEDLAEYVRWLATTGGRFITGQLVTVRSQP